MQLPDSTCTLEPGGLSHSPFDATVTTSYVWPHWRSCSSQLVLLVSQVETWPPELRAVAVYVRAPSANAQSSKAELVKQSRTTEPLLGGQGTERGRSEVT